MPSAERRATRFQRLINNPSRNHESRHLEVRTTDYRPGCLHCSGPSTKVVKNARHQGRHLHELRSSSGARHFHQHQRRALLQGHGVGPSSQSAHSARPSHQNSRHRRALEGSTASRASARCQQEAGNSGPARGRPGTAAALSKTAPIPALLSVLGRSSSSWAV